MPICGSDLIDANGEPWIDVTSAGWWNSGAAPELLPKEGELKFGTDDGRWTSFIKLNDPGILGGEWDNSFLISPNVLGTGFRRFYMKTSVERVDLNRSETSVFRRGSIFLVTLPTSLVVNKSNTVDGEKVIRQTRMSTLAEVYLALLDRRHMYGPWSSDDVIPARLRAEGKTRVQADTSLAPWTFGYRGISNTQAYTNMNAVARAKVRTYVSRLTEIDTGELEVADLPSVNLGTEIGSGTNITSILVSYSVQGIRTTYKCNLYSHELGRYQRTIRTSWTSCVGINSGIRTRCTPSRTTGALERRPVRPRTSPKAKRQEPGLLDDERDVRGESHQPGDDGAVLPLSDSEAAV